MVSTRGHPSEFPEPDLTPSRSPRKSNGGGTSSSGGRGSDRSWAHTPSNLTIIWLFISLPLVIWDTGYVLLRPLTMPGGSLHWPIWVPYGLYGRIDYMYGWKAVKAGNGFTSAQGFLNLVETLMYIYYLYLLFSAGRQSAKKGRGAAKPALIGFLGQQRTLEGRTAAIAVLVAYSAAVMTLSKTVLYLAPGSSSQLTWSMSPQARSSRAYQSSRTPLCLLQTIHPRSKWSEEFFPIEVVRQMQVMA